MTAVMFVACVKVVFAKFVADSCTLTEMLLVSTFLFGRAYLCGFESDTVKRYVRGWKTVFSDRYRFTERI